MIFAVGYLLAGVLLGAIFAPRQSQYADTRAFAHVGWIVFWPLWLVITLFEIAYGEDGK